MTKVAYEPISAKDALKQIKDLCSIMVDLAYSAILFEDKALVDEVKELRDSIVHLEYLLTMSLQLTVRDGKAAEATLPLVVLGNASTDIANCAVDIANVLTKGFTVHPTIKELAQKTSQNLARGKISEESILKDYSIREIVEKMNYSVSIVAVRKDNKWLIKPDGEMQLEAGNFLIASGSNSGISLLKMLIGGAAEEISPVEDDDIDQDEIEVLTDNIVDYLIGLKDTSEVMVDIAYGAVLYNSKELAQLVSNMEKRVDTIRNKAEIAVLKIAKTPTEDISSLQGLLRIIEATEDISDAANQIAKIVLEEIPSHPIIELVIEESDESIFEQTVEDASVIVGKTIPTGNYLDEFGIRVLALKRAAGHFFKPRRRTKIRVGDTIVFTGLKNACTAFQQREEEAVVELEAEIEATKKAAEEVVEEVVDKVSEEASEKAAKKATKKVADELATKAAEKTTEAAVKKATSEAAEAAAEKVTKETTDKVVSEIVSETIEKVKEEQPDLDEKQEKALKDAVETAAKKSAEEAKKKVEQAAKEAAEEKVEEKSDEVLKKAKKAASKKAAEEIESVVKETVRSDTERAAKKAANDAIKETVTVEKPEKIIKDAAEGPAKEAATESAERAVERTGKRAATKAAEEAATKAAEKAAKKVATKAAKKAAKDAKEVVEKEVKEAAQKAADEAAEKATKNN
ncbi:MAG: potassium channel family protein [Candidatus Heimdallarchaeota archaeon]